MTMFQYERYSGKFGPAVLKGGGGGGTTVTVPGPSEEELALLREQTEILGTQRDIIQEQFRVQNLLSPFLFEEAGVRPILDDEGQITGFENVDDPNDEISKEIERGFLERTQAALRGELPVNPALLNDLQDTEDQLTERLLRDLGPGFRTSTPGIESLAEFSESKLELLDAARRGDLTLAEQLGLARGQQQDLKVSDLLARSTGVASLPLQSAAAFQGNAAGFDSPISQFRRHRELQTQAALTAAQANASRGGGGSGIFGALAGGLAGGAGSAAGAALFSDRRLKEDAEFLGWDDHGLPVYEYRYIDSNERIIGYMADDVEKVYPQAVSVEQGFKMVDYSRIPRIVGA